MCSFFTPAVRGEEYFNYEYRNGSGLVTACGMSLLLIPEGAGQLNSVERAKVISERLNYLFETGKLSPDSLRVGYDKGEVVLELDYAGHPYLIATVDSNMARKFRGTNGSRTTLAYWWLSLLKDNLLIAESQQPRYSVSYGSGYVLERIYIKAMKDRDFEEGPLSISVVKNAINDLSEEDPNFLTDLERLYTAVPADFTLASASKLDKLDKGKSNNFVYNNSLTNLPGPLFTEFPYYNEQSYTTKPSVPGPGFNEYASTTKVEMPYNYPTPKPTPKNTDTKVSKKDKKTSDKGNVSYTEPSKPVKTPAPVKTPLPYTEPTYYEPAYYEPTYYEPVPPPSFPKDSPQTLPPGFLLQNLQFTPESIFNKYLNGNSPKDSISQVEYSLMNSRKEPLTTEIVTTYPFKCNLTNRKGAKYLRVNVDYKNGKNSSVIYKID